MDPTKYALTISREMKTIYEKTFYDARKAKENKKVIAWVPQFTPVEILYSMDIIPIIIEYYGIECAINHDKRFLNAAEKKGQSRDVCSYLNNIFGYLIEKEKSDNLPVGGLPDPDILIKANTLCEDQTGILGAISQYLKCPTFTMDVPIQSYTRSDCGIDSELIEYYTFQLEDLIVWLEKYTLSRFNIGNLNKFLHYSDSVGKLIGEINEYRKVIPAPMNVNDAYTSLFFPWACMNPMSAAELLKKVRDEVQFRVRNGIGAISEEKYRLLWAFSPPWVNLGLINYFEKYGAIFCMENGICLSGGLTRMDPSKPLLSLSKKYLTGVTNRFEYDIDLIANLVKDYKIDGVVSMDQLSCKFISLGQVEMKKKLQQEYGIPTLLIDMDHTDPSRYNDSQIKSQIESFIEILEKK